MFEKFFNSPRNVYFRHNFVITFEIRRKKDFFPLRTKNFPGFVSWILFFSRSLLLLCRTCVAQDFLRPPFPVGPSFSPEETPSTPGAARRKIRSATAEPECDVPSRSLRDAPPFATRAPPGAAVRDAGGAKGRGHQFFVRFKLTLVFTFTIFLLFARCNGATTRRDRSPCATVRRKTFFIR